MPLERCTFPAGQIPNGRKQLVAEQMVTVRNKRGFGHQEWQKMRERNEALDRRVYAPLRRP